MDLSQGCLRGICQCLLSSLIAPGLVACGGGSPKSSASSSTTVTYTALYSFGGISSDGQNPVAGLIQGSDGSLYGTTSFGGAKDDGTVFALSPSSGIETVLYSFAGGSTDGANPMGGLIQVSDGLYGTTVYGGANNNGTAFELSQSSGAETVLHSFGGGASDGKQPAAGLIQGSDGNLYGTTTYGGNNSSGTVFVLTLQ